MDIIWTLLDWQDEDIPDDITYNVIIQFISIQIPERGGLEKFMV